MLILRKLKTILKLLFLRNKLTQDYTRNGTSYILYKYKQKLSLERLENILLTKINNQCFVDQMLCTKLFVIVAIATLDRQKETLNSE